MAKKPKQTKNKPEKMDSKPKVIKKQEIKMFACDDVFNSNKIMLCDKGSGKIMQDLSKVKVTKTPNLKTCMEKAGQLQYRKCSKSEMETVTKNVEKSETKPEAQPQNTTSTVTNIEEPKPSTTATQSVTNEQLQNTKTVTEKIKETKSSTTLTKANVEMCFAQIGTSTICSKTKKEAVKAEGLSAITFDFAITDSDLVNKCQTAILGLSTDFVTCASLQSGDL
jgi:hypothetical protein